ETMWAYADYKDNMKFAEDMISHVVKNVHGKIKIKIQGKEIDFKTPWRRIKLIDIIREETGIDFSKISNFEEGKKIVKNIKVGVSRCENLGEIIIKVFEKKVQIKLIRPTFIYNYPSEAEELAKNSEKNKNFADSFKIVINGVEIGHSYCEQNDPHVLENYWKFSEKKAKGGDEEAQKMDEDFINALKIGMPPTSGLGVGIDRLAILLTDSPSIRDVILFPFMKPESDK
ncbi:MAG: amino acid--tRNA ligase-related protein, partial [Candidatus Pacearchaeota archaeon]|nr:amino acid--tRNA ligase-related protein [Candidatus Pacearchaeota archaeon]